MKVQVDRLVPTGDEVLVLLNVHLDAPRGGLLWTGPSSRRCASRAETSRIRLFVDEREALEAVGLSE